MQLVVGGGGMGERGMLIGCSPSSGGLSNGRAPLAVLRFVCHCCCSVTTRSTSVVLLLCTVTTTGLKLMVHLCCVCSAQHMAAVVDQLDGTSTKLQQQLDETQQVGSSVLCICPCLRI